MSQCILFLFFKFFRVESDLSKELKKEEKTASKDLLAEDFGGGIMTDSEMLDWFEENGEKLYQVHVGNTPRRIIIWLKGKEGNLFRTEGASLRNCIKRATKGEGRAVGW